MASVAAWWSDDNKTWTRKIGLGIGYFENVIIFPRSLQKYMVSWLLLEPNELSSKAVS